MPLTTYSGEVLGTLCVVDTKPLTLGAADLETLAILARRVAGELELRQTARHAAGRLAETSDEVATLRAIVGHLREGVLVVNAQRRVVLANDVLAGLFSLPASEIVGSAWEVFVERVARMAADPDDVKRRLRSPEEGPYAAREDLEIAQPEPRRLRWTSKPLALVHGTVQLNLFEDVTAEHDLARQSESMALVDPLTGLMNRLAGEEALHREAARARRAGGRLSVAVFDLEGFHQINERYGHAFGDEVLRQVAQRLKKEVRGADQVCRWGEAEFLALVPDADRAGAQAFIERTRAAIGALSLPAVGHVSASAGTAELGGDRRTRRGRDTGLGDGPRPGRDIPGPDRRRRGRLSALRPLPASALGGPGRRPGGLRPGLFQHRHRVVPGSALAPDGQGGPARSQPGDHEGALVG